MTASARARAQLSMKHNTRDANLFFFTRALSTIIIFTQDLISVGVTISIYTRAEERSVRKENNRSSLFRLLHTREQRCHGA